jgi:hypothetical protein
MINELLIFIAIGSIIVMAINIGIIFAYMNNGKYRIGKNKICGYSK